MLCYSPKPTLKTVYADFTEFLFDCEKRFWNRNTGLLIDGEVFYCSQSAASFSQGVRKYLGLAINLQNTHPPSPPIINQSLSYLHHILINSLFVLFSERAGGRLKF